MMLAIAEFVRTTSYDTTPFEHRLPPWIWSSFLSINKIHTLWRWHRRAVLYSNKDNFAALIGGHAIHAVFGDSTLLKMAAQSLLIATRLLACAEAQSALYQEGKQLISTIKADYPSPIHVAWPVNQTFSYLSPSTVYTWKAKVLGLQWRVLQVAFIVARICQKAFSLSMCIMDAIDAFYLSPASKNEAVYESCVNLIICLNALLEHKESLLEGFLDHRELIEKILHHSPITYAQLHTVLASSLKIGAKWREWTNGQWTMHGNGH